MTELSPARFTALRDGVFATSFAPGADTTRVGAEVEFLVYDAATMVPVPLIGGPKSLVARLRRYGAPLGWRERPAYGPIPYLDIPGQAVISFEPGGQIEISTLPGDGVSSVVRSIRDIVTPLRAALMDDGALLEAVGIDPYNPADCIPQQLPAERYQTMTRYLEHIGPYGIRMMRQTAAIQVSLDRGPRPAERWRLLNDLAPYLVAIFANSPHYCRADTGHQSYRAHCWRMLDPTRTGVAVAHTDPAAAYTAFALSANDILRSADGVSHSFGERLAGGADDAAWQNHLTTLFPEVRPRGHFEVRSCDAIDATWVAAPLVFLAGVAYDDRAANEAAILAGDSRAFLRTAGELGMRDASIARTSRDLFQLALAGARRLGERVVGGAELDVATEFFTTYTARDRSPADDRIIARLERDPSLRSG